LLVFLLSGFRTNVLLYLVDIGQSVNQLMLQGIYGKLYGAGNRLLVNGSRIGAGMFRSCLYELPPYILLNSGYLKAIGLTGLLGAEGLGRALEPACIEYLRLHVQLVERPLEKGERSRQPAKLREARRIKENAVCGSRH